MKTYFDRIFLSWRKGRGERRYIVGILEKIDADNIKFSYISDGVKDAEKDGFKSYTEFPETDKTYTKNVLDIISQRITPFVRRGSESLFKFWNVPESLFRDRWSIIGYTQGWLPTDNFEFLADFQAFAAFEFITDIAGLSHIALPLNTVQIGEELVWTREEDNPKDKNAILIRTRSGCTIGYIKKIHANIFNMSAPASINIKVHAIEKNGVIKRVFVKIMVDGLIQNSLLEKGVNNKAFNSFVESQELRCTTF